MSNNRCDRCGRPIKDPNAKYGWRCAEIIAAGGSLTIDLSAIFSMLEKYTDFSFESQNDLFDISEIFEKMLTLSSAPFSMNAENDYVEKGIALAYAMFSNYDELGDKARKSAVSHFIEEMHKEEETLPQASSRYTFAEEMNNKLIDYYEAENNPDTNDTVEDSIDELFGNIPLYHYLNTMFSKTEAEFEDSLIKGLNASYNAFMNLPYTSSMMGDIAVAEPQNAFAHEPYVSQFNIPGKNIKISDSQFGKKVGKHAEDFGLNPSNPESRYLIRNRINEIFIHKTEIRQGLWRGQGKTLPNGANASGKVYFYIQDKDVVVTDLNGNFITIIKEGINIPRIIDAEKIWP